MRLRPVPTTLRIATLAMLLALASSLLLLGFIRWRMHDDALPELRGQVLEEARVLSDVGRTAGRAALLRAVDDANSGDDELLIAAFVSPGLADRPISRSCGQAAASFHAPARFDDELRLEMAVSRLGSTSISTDQRVVRGEDLIAQADLHHVFVDRQTLGKTEIPDWLRTPLNRWLADS